jgi:hypothetical protein
MTKSSTQTLENAEIIIERFGGIRPMASKINVAVTTIQGWKKRGVIPENRYKIVTAAAAKHNIDLSDLVETAGRANENTPPPPQESKPAASETVAEVKIEKPEPKLEQTYWQQPKREEPNHEAMGASVIASMLHDDILQKIKTAEGRAVSKSLIMTISLIALTVAGLGMVIWPELNKQPDNSRAVELEQQTLEQEARIEALNSEIEQMKTEMQSIKDRQGFFGQIIPDDLGERLDSIKEQAQTARDSAVSAVEEAKAVSNEIVTGQADALRERLEALEKQLQEMGNAPLMTSLVQRYDAFTATAGGQNLLDNTTSQLAEIMQDVNPQNEEQLELTIDEARRENADLSQSFEGVPADDLKAAALLLTMTQLRSTLNRENQPFAEDLDVLKSLIGEDNPALTASIDKLAPHAQEGVLTTSGLSDELKTMTGDVVVASLKGEDVSFSDRFKVRMNQIFQLEKDGELITGTPTQATMAKAEAYLDAGDVQSAIAELQTLEGEQAEIIAPWLDKAQASLMADKLKQTLSTALSTKTFGGAGRYTTSGGTSPSQFIYDENSGTAVLKRGGAAPSITP